MGERNNNLWNRHYITLFIVNILISMTLYMTNTLMVGYLSGKGIAEVTVGSIVGMMSMASMCIRPFSGWITDRFSKKGLLVFFLGLYALVMLGYCVVNSVLIYYILRVLQGMAFGIVTTATMAYVSDFIPKGRIGEGIGFFGLGQSIAAAIGPFVGIRLSRIWNENFPFYGAVLSLTTALLLVVFLLPKDPEKYQEMGQYHFSFNNFIAKEALLYAVITVAISAVNGIETSYIVSYALSISIGDISWYFTISAIALFLSRFFFGRITDKHSFAFALYPGIIMIVLALMLLGSVSVYPYTIIMALAAVFKAIGVGILQPALQANCLKSVEPERRGVASSTYYIGTDLGQGMSTVAAGHLISTCGYSGMYLCYILPLLVVSILYSAANMIRRQVKHKEHT